MKKVILIIVILLIIVGGFYVFTHKNVIKHLFSQASPASSQANSATTSTSPQAPHQSASRSFGRGQGIAIPSGATPFFGQVTSVNDTTITIQRQGKNANATPITLTLTSSTQYTGGTQNDIQTGTRVAGYGIANSDGSLSAEQLVINPNLGGRRNK